MDENTIRVVVDDDNAVRAAILVEGLREAGIQRVDVLGSTTHLIRRITAINRHAVRPMRGPIR